MNGDAIRNGIEQVMSKVIEYNHLEEIITAFFGAHDLFFQGYNPNGPSGWGIVNSRGKKLSKYYRTYSEAVEAAFQIVSERLDATQAVIAEEISNE